MMTVGIPQPDAAALGAFAEARWLACRWWRDGWARAHDAIKGPVLAVHEERIWARYQRASRALGDTFPLLDETRSNNQRRGK